MQNNTNSASAMAQSPSVVQKVVAKLKKDVFVYGPAIIIPALLGMVNIIVFTRVFDPSDYGQYAIVLSTILFVSTLITQWIQQSIQRYRPVYKESNGLIEFDRNLQSLLAMMTYGALLFLLLAPISKLLFGLNLILYLTVILIVITQMLFVLMSTILQSDYRAGEYRRFNLINAILKSALSLLIVFFVQKSTDSIFLGILLAQLIVLVPMMRTTGYKAIFSLRLTLQSKQFIKMFVQYGFPMIGWFIGNSLLNLVDRYMLGYYHSAQEVGIYTATYSVVSASIGLFCTPLLMAAHPIIMNTATTSDDKEIQRIISVFSKVYLLIIFPIFIYLTVVRSDVTSFLLGDEYQVGSSILPYMMFGLIMWNFGMYGHKGFEIKNKTRTMLMFVICCVVVNVGLNVLLIPKYAYHGAAIASTISLTVYPVCVYLFSSKTIQWKMNVRSLLSIFSSSMVAAIGTYFIRFYLGAVDIVNLVVCGFAFLIMYLVGLSLLKEINLNKLVRVNMKNRLRSVEK
ncbi:polysaccharide biosynthesis protein [Paenibacillus curdlanolyticus YK9]|uniref:Polysaccharide biosynthesis protein n=1 Tax=Paenibacillus curdlanolyticus YK9 TaxID=717606 RepID=E0I7A7_9BACL|nr:lipopolysaccharide biosynthesis protein [Paenibacillus curdlanolyticus]EFM11923.1 polysaccharide biosynthesis protein [Paenibacillus curdlanolyticus YK9]